MLRLIFLLILPLHIFAGSTDAITHCKSKSGRTIFSFSDSDLSGTFQNGTLSIDNKKLIYSSNGDAEIVQDFKNGVYTLSYYHDNHFLTFYALPKSVKNTTKGKMISYSFTGILTPNTTDPRSLKRLGKTITMKCEMIYNLDSI